MMTILMDGSIWGEGSSPYRKRSCPTLDYFWWYKIYIPCPVLSWLQVYFALRWMLLNLERKHEHLQTPHHHTLVSYCSFTTWILSGVCDKAEANSHSFWRNDKKLVILRNYMKRNIYFPCKSLQYNGIIFNWWKAWVQ